MISKPWRVRALHPAQRRLLAGRVGVEAEVDAFRQPRELSQVLLGECRAHCRDDRLEPCLPQRDHVGVPLHHHRAVLLRDRRPGEMEPVEDAALLEQLALGRVHVLPLERVVVVELPRLEADHPATRVGEREHQPLWEVVVATLIREARRPQLVGREALLLRLGREAATRREPEAELLRDLLSEPAAREILAHRLARRPFPQVPLEEDRRLLEHARALARDVGATRPPAARPPRTRA